MLFSSALAGFYPAFRVCRSHPTNCSSEKERDYATEDLATCARRLATRMINLFALCVGPIFGLGALWKLYCFLARRSITGSLLDDSWQWYLHGTSTYMFAWLSCSMLPFFKDSTIMLRARTLRLDFDLDSRSLREVVERHPDWQMLPYLSNDLRDGTKLQTFREMLEDDDDNQSHVQQQVWPIAYTRHSEISEMDTKRSFQSTIDSWA